MGGPTRLGAYGAGIRKTRVQQGETKPPTPKETPKQESSGKEKHGG